jgi:hypothetical protein
VRRRTGPGPTGRRAPDGLAAAFERAHIICPQASLLIQPLVQAMCLGNTVDQVASGVLYIHPALTEVIEQALLNLWGRHMLAARSATLQRSPAIGR